MRFNCSLKLPHYLCLLRRSASWHGEWIIWSSVVKCSGSSPPPTWLFSSSFSCLLTCDESVLAIWSTFARTAVNQGGYFDFKAEIPVWHCLVLDMPACSDWNACDQWRCSKYHLQNCCLWQQGIWTKNIQIPKSSISLSTCWSYWRQEAC